MAVMHSKEIILDIQLLKKHSTIDWTAWAMAHGPRQWLHKLKDKNILDGMTPGTFSLLITYAKFLKFAG